MKEEIVKVGEELREELIAEEVALEELERSLSPLIPSIGDRPYREPRHLDRDIKVSAVFDRRRAVELEKPKKQYQEREISAGDGIRTRERLRDRALNPAPLTWLGNPRSQIWVIDRLLSWPIPAL